VLLALRDNVVGRETMDRALREYARRWAFKHPTPADFFRTVENVSGADLSWFWSSFFYGTSLLDIAIDGTDEVTPDGWLIKGGGAAHLREKVVAAAADRFVVIADSSKPVDALRGPVPLEIFAFGAASTLARLGPEVERRDVPPSPDGGVIADYRGAIGDPAELAARLEADAGIAAHGLFPPTLVSEVLIGRGDEVERTTISG